MGRAVATPRLPVALLALVFLVVAMVAFARPVHAYSNTEWYNAYSGKCLDVPYGNYYYGQKVQQYDCNGGSNQLWHLEAHGGGYAMCSPSEWCIARQTPGGNGSKAFLAYNDCFSYECWALRVSGGHWTTFVSFYDARCLDDPGWSTANGAWQQVWDCTGNPNQIWSAI